MCTSVSVSVLGSFYHNFHCIAYNCHDFHYFSKEEGFTYTEMNASASRGKKTLQAEVASSLGNLSIDAFLTGL